MFWNAIVIALFTIIRTDRNMLLACYSHKHISYRIRTIIRKAIIVTLFVIKNFYVFKYCSSSVLSRVL
nr:hypothetical protein [Wolbachia endosymbiont (group A) of Scambus nigricans]